MKLAHRLIGSLGRAREEILDALDTLEDADADDFDAQLYENIAELLQHTDEVLDEVMNG